MRRAVRWIPGAAAVILGFLNVYRLRWVGDDAFITFRYIDNWLAGLGLVYNPGERVEGYTHFLWLCAVALLRRLGTDPVIASQWLGIAAATATIALFAWISAGWRPRTGTPDSSTAAIPFTAIVLALHYDFAVWGTGGLETAAFTFLVSVAFYLLAVRRDPHPGRLAAAGLVLTLAMMTRPDGAVFYAVGVLFVAAQAWAESRSIARVLRAKGAILFPFALIYLPYLLWKVSYYGQILPNTYYAKSANLAYWSQGFVYLWLYFRAYPLSLLFVLAIPWLAIRGTGKRRSILTDPTTASVVLALAWTLAYLVLFVARVGGDFMYARFVCPVIPLMYFSIEVLVRDALSSRIRLLALALIVLPILFAVQGKLGREAIFQEEGGRDRSPFGPHSVTDERWYYTHDLGAGRSLIDGLRQIGGHLAVYFNGTNVRVVEGGQAALAYYGRFHNCIDRYGLTDPYVAHLPVPHRSRPGHEKVAPVDYLLARGVQFEFLRPPFKKDPYRLVYFRAGDQIAAGCLFTYDRDLMRHLRERFPDDVRSVDFEAYLDEWLRRLPSMPIDQIRRDYDEFREFYFAHNPDPEREGKILVRLKGSPATRGPAASDSPATGCAAGGLPRLPGSRRVEGPDRGPGCAPSVDRTRSPGSSPSSRTATGSHS